MKERDDKLDCRVLAAGLEAVCAYELVGTHLSFFTVFLSLQSYEGEAWPIPKKTWEE